MATKKEITVFNNQVKTLVESNGAILNPKNEIGQEWILPSICGEISISVCKPAASKIYSIYVKFMDGKLAKEMGLLDVNSTSWKQNIHDYSASVALVELEDKLTEWIEKT